MKKFTENNTEHLQSALHLLKTPCGEYQFLMLFICLCGVFNMI